MRQRACIPCFFQAVGDQSSEGHRRRAEPVKGGAVGHTRGLPRCPLPPTYSASVVTTRLLFPYCEAMVSSPLLFPSNPVVFTVSGTVYELHCLCICATSGTRQRWTLCLHLLVKATVTGVRREPGSVLSSLSSEAALASCRTNIQRTQDQAQGSVLWKPL